jgi:mannitol/fructose-specific phosphotransferase system IIA component (Ntr-type)
MAERISKYLDKNCVMSGMATPDKDTLLTEMVSFMASYYSLKNSALITDKIFERESDMSTGIGYGIAIPHARIHGIDRIYMVVAQSVCGIDFQAIDDAAVFIIFMLISPNNTAGAHTQVLSSISRIVSNGDVRDTLKNAKNADTFYDAIVAAEDAHLF